ncbi:MAG: hypothetical protein GY795_22495 [Desulfobacterales bacterium]|nr:hypothetical protein [Desulfobacterales bacterium]
MKFWPAAQAGGAKPEHTVQSCISYMKARMLRFRSAHLRRRPKFHFGTPFFRISGHNRNVISQISSFKFHTGIAI